MNDDEDIVKEFLVESYENLDCLDRERSTSETDPQIAKPWQVFFERFTPSRTSGISAFNQLQAVAHVGEKSRWAGCELETGPP